MLTKRQQTFILKLKENELFSHEQTIWAKPQFYINIGFLRRVGLIKFRKNIDNNKYIYSLTDLGLNLAKILNKIKESSK